MNQSIIKIFPVYEGRNYRRVLICVKRVASIILLLFFVASSLWVLYYRFFNPSSTNLINFKIKESIIKKKPSKIKILWVSYEKISVNIKQAVVVAEDSSFLHHSGFNYQAIKNAYWQNVELGTTKYGASTISQQVVKNLFLWSSKTWSRKIMEAYMTVLVELLWDKKRILEVYLNIIEYGDEVFGIEYAANKYFGVKASELDLKQSSLIAAILPDPSQNTLLKPSDKIIKKSKIIRNLVRHYKTQYSLDLL